MAQPFKKIALFARHREKSEAIRQTFSTLIPCLQAAQIEISIDTDTAALYGYEGSLNCVPAERLCENAELLLVVGGDGSMLQAAKLAIESDIPLLGVNRGRLGFLTDIMPEDIPTKITAIISGKYHEEKRFLLTAQLYRQQTIIHENIALNDAVLLPSMAAHMIEFEIHINDRLVSTQRADGIIVATPTGSTAYALSAGGPIIHPSLDNIVMVPMFPHTLSSRPIVIDGTSEITLAISRHNQVPPRISCDGQTALTIELGEKVRIKKHSRQIRLIHPTDYDYYQTLRSKLGWESKHNDGTVEPKQS